MAERTAAWYARRVNAFKNEARECMRDGLRASYHIAWARCDLARLMMYRVQGRPILVADYLARFGRRPTHG